MKLVAFTHNGSPRLGVVRGESIQPLAGAKNLQVLIESGEIPELDTTSAPLRWNDVTLLPVIHPTRNVFCVGWNYRKHFSESIGKREGQGPEELPTIPTFFTKATHTVASAWDDLPLHASLTSKLDWEVELAVVLGRGGRDIPVENALSHVYGYTVANDISARDVQRAHGGQWFKGKSLDATCPLGPVLVTADEIADPQTLALSCYINGEAVQSDTTANQIFSVAQLIAQLSCGMTLEPGDVILTGTPDGIGAAMTPPRFLQEGDCIESVIECIGRMRNRVFGAYSGAVSRPLTSSLASE